jgi:hypothetical protein
MGVQQPKGKNTVVVVVAWVATAAQWQGQYVQKILRLLPGQ